MNPLEVALRRIASDLGDAGRRWAVIGGLAVSARAEPRTTRDVDLAVAVADDADAEALVFTLQSCGYRVLSLLFNTRRLPSREYAGRPAEEVRAEHFDQRLQELESRLSSAQTSG